MALATGIFNITNNPTELNQRSFAASIMRLFPNGSAPLFALTSQSGKTKAKSSTHGYFSKTLTFNTLTLAAGVLIGATNIVVPSTSGMIADAVFFNPRTRENVRITAVVDATNITVVRAFGRVAAAAMNIGDVLFQVGSASAEGSARPASRRLTTTYVPNFTQIFRNAWALTDTARASLAENGFNNMSENRRECAMFHSIDIETAIIWGQAKMDTTGTQPVHSTQGIVDSLEQYCPQNTTTAGATTTFDQLVSYLEPAFAYATDMGNPNERIGFVDSLGMSILHKLGKLYGQIEIYQTETKFGMKFTSFQFYKGTIHLKEHPLFNGLGRTGSMLVVDPAALQLAYLEGRDTKAEEYGANNKIIDGSGVDAVGGSLTSELAVELVNPYANVWIDGLIAAA